MVILFICGLSKAFSCDYLSQSGCAENDRCIYTKDDKSLECVEKFSGERPLIAFPFASSDLVSCDQGPHMPDEATHSHAWLNSMDALDLRTSENSAPAKVYAGLDGVVAIYNQCKTKNDQCGAGFGNQVKIFSSDGVILFYAHLEKVYVKGGAQVKKGDLIGLEGNTGWTGKDNRHLHISAHFDWRVAGKVYWSNLGWLPRSIPFEFIAYEYGANEKARFSTKTVNCVRKKHGKFLEAALRGVEPYQGN